MSVAGSLRPLSKSLRLLHKRAGYSLHISKVSINSLMEDGNDAGSSRANKKTRRNSDKPIRSASVNGV